MNQLNQQWRKCIHTLHSPFIPTILYSMQTSMKATSYFIVLFYWHFWDNCTFIIVILNNTVSMYTLLSFPQYWHFFKKNVIYHNQNIKMDSIHWSYLYFPNFICTHLYVCMHLVLYSSITCLYVHESTTAVKILKGPSQSFTLSFNKDTYLPSTGNH